MNVRELRSQAKARKIPKYYKLGKAQLLSALGMSAEAKAHKSQATRRKAIAFNATKEGGDSSVKKALVKGRIVRSIKRGLVAEEKKQGRALTQEEKRTVAARALATEVKAIKAGKPENKPDRGGNHLEAQISNTKAAIADVQANIHKAKEISASTGQPFDRYHKAMRGELEQHKASLSKLEKAKAIRSGTPENKPKRGNGQPITNISEAERRHALNTSLDHFTRTESKNLADWEKEAKSRKSPLSKEMKQVSLKKAQQALTEKQATWQRVTDAHEQETSHAQQLAVINQGLKHGHSIQQIEGGYAMFQGSDRIGNLTAKTPQQVLAKSQKFEQETEGYQSQKGDRKKMSVVSGGQKTKGKSGANLTSVEGGSQSLQDLFKAADRIGNKYQDGNDPADLGAKRAAKQMRQETGVASLVDRATGGSGLRALDGGKGKKPGTVTDLESKRKKPKSSFSHTPPPGVSVAEHRANLRRQYGATSGTRNENLSKKEERRSEIGRGDEGESRIRRGEVADRVSESKPPIKTEKLNDFKSSTGEPIENATAYGSLVIATHKHKIGSAVYAQVYDRKTGKIAYNLTGQPINGKLKQLKSAVEALASKHDFGKLDSYSDSQKKALAMEVSGALSHESLEKAKVADRVSEPSSGSGQLRNEHTARQVWGDKAIDKVLSHTKEKPADRVSEPKGEQGKAAAQPFTAVATKEGVLSKTVNGTNLSTLAPSALLHMGHDGADELHRRTAFEGHNMTFDQFKTHELARARARHGGYLKDRSNAPYDQQEKHHRDVEFSEQVILGHTGSKGDRNLKAAHQRRIDSAIESGNLTKSKAKQLGHFDAYPDLAATHGQKKAVSESEKAKKPSATLLEMAKNLHNLDSKDTHILRQMAATHLGLDISDIKEMGGSDRGLTVTRRSGQKTLIPAGKSTATRGTKATPWAGNDAPTKTRSSRGEMVRGRSID